MPAAQSTQLFSAVALLALTLFSPPATRRRRPRCRVSASRSCSKLQSSWTSWIMRGFEDSRSHAAGQARPEWPSAAAPLMQPKVLAKLARTQG
uniref:Secreted protein n=1 Tax=Macrostomum lignano TaxID=282301 RepID=A0A1I8FRC0_9PLAT